MGSVSTIDLDKWPKQGPMLGAQATVGGMSMKTKNRYDGDDVIACASCGISDKKRRARHWPKHLTSAMFVNETTRILILVQLCPTCQEEHEVDGCHVTWRGKTRARRMR